MRRMDRRTNALPTDRQTEGHSQIKRCVGAPKNDADDNNNNYDDRDNNDNDDNDDDDDDNTDDDDNIDDDANDDDDTFFIEIVKDFAILMNRPTRQTDGHGQL